MVFIREKTVVCNSRKINITIKKTFSGKYVFCMLLMWLIRKAWTVTAILSDFRPQAESGLWSSTSIYHRTLHCPVFHAPFVLLYLFFSLFLRVISENPAQMKGLSSLSWNFKASTKPLLGTVSLLKAVAGFSFPTKSCWRFLSARHANTDLYEKWKYNPR